MNISKFDELPVHVKEKLKQANIYYCSKYVDYEKSNDNSVLYLYNESFIQVVTIKSLKKIFSFARFPSEPFEISKINHDEMGLKEFLDEVLITLKTQQKVDWIESTFAGALYREYPTKSQRIRWGNYIIDLSDKTLEQVFNGFDSKHRNMVRRGEHSEIVIKFGGRELLEDYLTLDKQTWLRSNKNIDNSILYQRYIEAFGENLIVGVAYNTQGIPQCGLIGVYNNAMFYYMFGASADKPEAGSTHYLQFQTIKLMMERGVNAYNFVGCRINVDKGSKYERIQHFKKGFGGMLVECYMFKAILNNTKFKLFKVLYSIKGKTLSSDAIDEEVHKWTDIN